MAERLSPAAWMAARWVRIDGRGVEHWTATGDALVGVGLTLADGRTRGFEILIIHELDGRLSYTAMPNGAAPVSFPMKETAPGSITFENKEHDFPQRIRYTLPATDPDHLTGVVSGPGAEDELYQFARGAPGRAAELEDAQRALAAKVAAHGVDAWLAGFDEKGIFIGPEGARAVGREAIRAAAGSLPVGPGQVVASGMSPAGDVGYTVSLGFVAIWHRPPGGGPWSIYCGSITTVTRPAGALTMRALPGASSTVQPSQVTRAPDGKRRGGSEITVAAEPRAR